MTDDFDAEEEIEVKLVDDSGASASSSDGKLGDQSATSVSTNDGKRSPLMNDVPLTLLYLNVLIIATCGLVYELLAGTLAIP